MTKILSKLSKSEILSLPGFEKYSALTVRQLKPILKKGIKYLDINFRGVRIDDYVNRINEIKAQKKSDDELFKRISSKTDSLKKQKRSHEQYKQSLKDNALFERILMNIGELYSLPKPSENKLYIESLMNIDVGYTTSKYEDRRCYEDNVSDKDKYQEEFKHMIAA